MKEKSFNTYAYFDVLVLLESNGKIKPWNIVKQKEFARKAKKL